MADLRLTRDQIEELEIPWSCHEEWSLGSGRWHEHKEGVFEHGGSSYLVRWNEGLTEYQEHEFEWDYAPSKEIFSFQEAEQYEVIVKKWRAKNG